MTRLLLQTSQGMEDVPGLHAALTAATPVPTALPARHLSREEFLNNFVTPWLAERLCRRASLNDVVRDYRRYARPTAAIGRTCGNIVIDRGVLAVEFGALRDVLRHHDDALLAVMCASMQAGTNGITYTAQSYTSDPWLVHSLITDVRQVANYLATIGATLHPNWPRTGPIVLAPVITHLRQVARTLAATQVTVAPLI